MSEFKECKVELGKKEGCYCNDVLYLPISPAVLSELVDIFEERAMNAERYSSQGLERETKDYFQKAFDFWRRTREELDRHNEEKKAKDE